MESEENKKEEKLLVLAVVGMPATGKSEVLKTLVDKYKFFHLYYGGITIDEVKRRGLEVNEVNERFVREDMRKSGDMGIYSRFMIPKIEEAIRNGYKRILLESMYNIWEYEIIKEKYGENFKVLAIHSDFDVRLKRIGSRADRKLNLDELNSRQISEAKNLGKGTVISLADYHMINNGENMDVFEADIKVFLKKTLNFEIENEYLKDFNGWNEKKKVVDSRKSEMIRYPKIGEVWMVSYGNNIGYEENGGGPLLERPVLVVKKFNNQMFLTVPLSSKQKEFDFYYNFVDPNNLKVAFILAHLKLLSVKRFERNMYEIPIIDLEKVNTQIKKLFDIDPKFLKYGQQL